MGTQCVSALIAAWMAWRYIAGTLGVHSLLFGALGLGTAYALALPVQTALVPALVDDADAADAVKMNSVSYNAGRALAPALCMLAFAVADTYLIFAFNAITFVIFAFALRHVKRIADEKPLHTTIADFLGQLGPVSTELAVLLIRRLAFGSLRYKLGALLTPAVFAAAIRPMTSALAGTPSRQPRARARDGLMIALRNRRILLLLAIVAAVTLADDPILVLSPAVVHARLHVSSTWAGYFISALGWGSVLGSLPPTPHGWDSARRATRRAAFSLIVLGASVVIFALAPSPQTSLVAACSSGAAALMAGAAAQASLLKYKKAMSAKATSVASITALWAIAWAGTKPFASLIDGSLAGSIGIVPTSIVLVSPALVIALCEIMLPRRTKELIKARTALFCCRSSR